MRISGRILRPRLWQFPQETYNDHGRRPKVIGRQRKQKSSTCGAMTATLRFRTGPLFG